MKLLDKLSMLLFTAAVIMLVSCEMAVPPFGPTDRPDLGGDDDTVAVVVLDTAGWNVPAEAITVAEARAICSELESGATTGTKYYVKGFVKDDVLLLCSDGLTNMIDKDDIHEMSKLYH